MSNVYCSWGQLLLIFLDNMFGHQMFIELKQDTLLFKNSQITRVHHIDMYYCNNRAQEVVAGENLQQLQFNQWQRWHFIGGTYQRAPSPKTGENFGKYSCKRFNTWMLHYSDAYLWPWSWQFLPPVRRLVVAEFIFFWWSLNSRSPVLIGRVPADICFSRYNQERDNRDNITDSVPKPPSPLKGCLNFIQAGFFNCPPPQKNV